MLKFVGIRTLTGNRAEPIIKRKRMKENERFFDYIVFGVAGNPSVYEEEIHNRGDMALHVRPVRNGVVC